MFGFEYGDWIASLWGLANGIVAIMALVVNVLEFRDIWATKRWTKPLAAFIIIGVFCAVGSAVAAIVYTVIAIHTKEGKKK